MSEYNKNFRFFGALCAVSAAVLLASSVKFWFDRNDPYSKSANWLMIVMGAVTAICFAYIASAMFFPKRFKRFWKWWHHGG